MEIRTNLKVYIYIIYVENKLFHHNFLKPVFGNRHK